MRLRRIVVAALLCLFSSAATVPVSSTLAADNPIVLENQQPGSSGWFWSKGGDDATGQIKGYASATSVNQNESITFYVTVNPAQTYSIDFYRLGWYAGNGGTPSPSCRLARRRSAAALRLGPDHGTDRVQLGSELHVDHPE